MDEGAQLGVSYTCPDHTTRLVFKLESGSRVVFSHDSTTVNESGEPADGEACFASFLSREPCAFEWLNVESLGGRLVLIPVGFVALPNALTPPTWPCSRKNAKATMFLSIGDGCIRHVILLNAAAMKDSSRNAIFGGSTLSNALRSLEAGGRSTFEPNAELTWFTRRVGAHLPMHVLSQAAGGSVSCRPRAAAEVAASNSARDDGDRGVATVPLAPLRKLCIPLRDGGLMQFDVGAARRRNVQPVWESVRSLGDAEDLSELCAVDPIDSLPESDSANGSSEGASHRESFLFCAHVARRSAGPASSALLAWRGSLYHVSLTGGSECVFGVSATAYKRACKSARRASEGRLQQTCDVGEVTFLVFPHSPGGASGPVSEAEQRAVVWTALLGAQEASRFLVANSGQASAAKARGRGGSGRSGGVGSGDQLESDEDDAAPPPSEGAAVVEGSIGAFLARAPSCNRRGVSLSQPMIDAMNLGTLRKVGELGRDITVARCNVPEDASAEPPKWYARSDGAECVSESSLLAANIGVLGSAYEDECDYGRHRRLRTVVEVELGMVARRLEHWHGSLPTSVPPMMRGNARVRSVDLDLYERLVTGVLTSHVIEVSLVNGAAVFSMTLVAVLWLYLGEESA